MARDDPGWPVMGGLIRTGLAFVTGGAWLPYGLGVAAVALAAAGIWILVLKLDNAELRGQIAANARDQARIAADQNAAAARQAIDDAAKTLLATTSALSAERQASLVRTQTLITIKQEIARAPDATCPVGPATAAALRGLRGQPAAIPDPR